MKLGTSHRSGPKPSRFAQFEGLLRAHKRSGKRRACGGHRQSLVADFIDSEVQEMLEEESQIPWENGLQ